MMSPFCSDTDVVTISLGVKQKTTLNYSDTDIVNVDTLVILQSAAINSLL